MNTTNAYFLASRVLLRGLLVGIVLGVLVVAALYAAQAVRFIGNEMDPVQQIIAWVMENLRGSVYPFAAVLILFFMLIERLRHLIAIHAPLEQISQSEYLTDLCTSLFFGIGVIWTAIGMRSALLAGLGGLDSSTAAEVGAFEILQRLVDGGILLALSTTIVGGVGGYMMRIYKSILTGGALRQRYMAESKASEQAVLDRLDAIHAILNASNTSVPVAAGQKA